jgi:LPXTG-motif cell wall-anchored protein
MKSTSAVITKLLLAGGVCFIVTAAGHSQVQTTTKTEAGTATHDVTVERGTVALVNGNDLYVTMEDGSLRHFPNVPESARVNIDGKQYSIHDLKPGMKLQRTIKVTNTPQTVTTVQTVTGKVWHVTPPSSVILTLADGTNQAFKIPKDQKFNVDGKMVDAWGLKKGMNVSATKVVEQPVTVTSTATNVTGHLPPPPPDQPILVLSPHQPAPEVASAPAAAAEPAPKALPKTGSELPLIGLLGIACMGASFGIGRLRRS